MPKERSQTVSLEYAGQSIPVSLEFSDRMRLSISVHPDCSVTAKAPTDRSIDEILAYLKRRSSWIAKQRRHFESYQPLPEEKRYVSGETHLYLGRQYRLRVHKSGDMAMKLRGRYLHAYVSMPKKPQVVKAALDVWYQTHALDLFQNRINRYMETATFLQGCDILLSVRPMKRRWGSCSSTGTITLNTDLVKTPLHCIEYVIMHELCHLRVHDHSPAFFRLLCRYMPDWKIRKKRLDSTVIH